MNDQQPRLLVAEDIVKSFDGRKILAGVSLEIRAGECVGLTGDNGSGKSTLLNILAGRLPADSGKVLPVGGRRINVGLIAQRFQLNPGLSVAEAVFRGSNQPDSVAVQSTRKLLAQAGIALDPEARIGGLTRPELGLVESMRLWADESADVVLVDEVSATFNPREIDELHWIIGQIREQGRSIVYVSHRPGEIQAVADRLILLRGGKLHDPAQEERPKPESETIQLSSRAPSRSLKRHEILGVRGLNVGPVSDASFSIAGGQIVGLLGARHSGVKEVVDALTGHKAPKFGDVRVLGREISLESPDDVIRAGIAHYKPELSAKTLARNLTAGNVPKGDLDTASAPFEAMLVAMDAADEKTSKLFGKHSPGQRASRVLSLMLSSETPLLVLEEPTVGLDQQARHNLFEELEAAADRGMAILILTPETEELISWTERLLVFEQGKLTNNWETSTVTRVRIDAVFRDEGEQRQEKKTEPIRGTEPKNKIKVAEPMKVVEPKTKIKVADPEKMAEAKNKIKVAEPEKPAEPQKPVESEKPAESETKIKVVEPEKQEKPAEPGSSPRITMAGLKWLGGDDVAEG